MKNILNAKDYNQHVRLGEDQHYSLKLAAMLQRTTMTQMLNELIDKYIEVEARKQSKV